MLRFLISALFGAILLWFIPVQAVKAEDSNAATGDFPIVRSYWLDCPLEESLADFFPAKDAQDAFEIAMRQLDERRPIGCIANQESFRIENITQKTAPNGAPYLCFTVNAVAVDFQFDRCTLPFFVSTLATEIDRRQGKWRVFKQNPNGLIATCLEGGRVYLEYKKGKPITRRSAVFDILTAGETTPKRVSGSLEKIITDGCRGVDYEDLIGRAPSSGNR